MKSQGPVTPSLVFGTLTWLGVLVLVAAVTASTVSVLRPAAESAQAQGVWRLSGSAQSWAARAVDAANAAPLPARAAARVVHPASPPPMVVGSTQQALINQDRARYGLHPLTWSSCLASIAYSNAYRMARQGFISHTDGPSLDLGCHLGYQAGENVGFWSAAVNDAQMNTTFMNSPDHRANILGPYHYVAASWVTAPNGYAYIAVEFG